MEACRCHRQPYLYGGRFSGPYRGRRVGAGVRRPYYKKVPPPVERPSREPPPMATNIGTRMAQLKGEDLGPWQRILSWCLITRIFVLRISGRGWPSTIGRTYTGTREYLGVGGHGSAIVGRGTPSAMGRTSAWEGDLKWVTPAADLQPTVSVVEAGPTQWGVPMLALGNILVSAATALQSSDEERPAQWGEPRPGKEI